MVRSWHYERNRYQQNPHKIFAVFAIIQNDILISEPAEIARILLGLPDTVHVLPWYGGDFNMDFTDRESLQVVVDKLNAVVAEVEPVDPWVKEVFGIEGKAEGVVCYPGAGETHPVDFFADFAFKAKGEKHKEKQTKEAVQIDPEVVASIEEFVQMFVTEPRLEQGLAVVGSAEKTNIGPFLKWFSMDVVKESEDELEVADLTWEQVQKAVQTAARNWFLSKIQ